MFTAAVDGPACTRVSFGWNKAQMRRCRISSCGIKASQWKWLTFKMDVLHIAPTSARPAIRKHVTFKFSSEVQLSIIIVRRADATGRSKSSVIQPFLGSCE